MLYIGLPLEGASAEKVGEVCTVSYVGVLVAVVGNCKGLSDGDMKGKDEGEEKSVCEEIGDNEEDGIVGKNATGRLVTGGFDGKVDGKVDGSDTGAKEGAGTAVEGNGIKGDAWEF